MIPQLSRIAAVLKGAFGFVTANRDPVTGKIDIASGAATLRANSGVTDLTEITANYMETFDIAISAVSNTLSSGILYLSSLGVARKNLNVSKCLVATSTIAAAGMTLARVGLYETTDFVTFNLVASCPNDTLLFSATNTGYVKNFSANYSLVVGRYYFIGILVVGTTMPNVCASSFSVSAFNTSGLGLRPSPRYQLGGQSDLPATVTSPTKSTNPHYAQVF